ncbi:MAG: AI-2E family transporter [Clostridia bacterium]|nr:AI-2E family transporter [Clostridia bacterium]
MKQWHFNRKNTTYAIYACAVILFAVLCVALVMNLEAVGAFFSGIISNIFSPIFIGIMLAYLLNPILHMFEGLFAKWSKNKLGKKGLRALGMVSAYLLFFAFLAIFFAILLPQLIQSISDLADLAIAFFNDLPFFLQNLIDTNETFAEIYETVMTSFNIQGLLDDLQEHLGTIVIGSFDFAMSVFDFLKNALLGLFFSVYFLASKEFLIAQIKRFFLAFFSFRRNVTFGHFMTTVDQKFGQFIRGKILDSCIVMLIVYVLTWIFGIPYYPMIALIIGITDLIPVFGPFIGAIPSALIIFIAPTGGFRAALIFAAIILVVQQIDGNIIAPKILGDRVGMGGVWIMIAVTTMGALFGIIGMFFGVPIFAVIYTLVGEAIHKKLVKKGLAEQLEADADDEAPKESPTLFMRLKNILKKKQPIEATDTPVDTADHDDTSSDQ